MKRYPFDYDHSRSFISQVSEWIAEALYDILPKWGFEVRDEQIYMAYQLERAFADKRTIFAEAGVGTGKTLVYLMYAVCYARYTGKPAIIACADESLIEQLVKPNGDIAKLAQYLDVIVDSRLGKSPDQYLCVKKLDGARYEYEDKEIYQDIYRGLPAFVYSHEAMQAFYPYGDRKNYSRLNDEQWSKINWDTFQDCLVCDKRHRCGQTLSRDHYRKAADIIICSHDFYMEHIWTYESRKRGGQLPLLPEHSSVVFDEGHLLETAAQKALTYTIKHAVFEEIITRLLKGEVRETLALAVEDALTQSEALFHLLERQSIAVAGSERKEILFNQDIFHQVNKLMSLIAAIEEELVFESGMFSLEDYQLKIVEEHLEMAQLALGLFQQPGKPICWVVEDAAGLALVIMPRMVKEVLKERVFSQKMPIVFSSATLSVDGSFHYAANNLGIDDYLSFSTPSPFDYEQQMKVVVPSFISDDHFTEKMKFVVSLLESTKGRALILFPSKEEMESFMTNIIRYPVLGDIPIFCEGRQEISCLIEAFQNDEHSVLCSVTLWEGLDIPGPSLSNVIIWSLPFPPHDPVFSAKRNAAADPFEEVDLPYMMLRLRQGMGRLIRSRDDRGIVAILGSEMQNNRVVREKVKEIMPSGVIWETNILR